MKFKPFALLALLSLVLVAYGAAEAAQPADQDEIVQQLDAAIQSLHLE